jgi:hypothetical protein
MCGSSVSPLATIPFLHKRSRLSHYFAPECSPHTLSPLGRHISKPPKLLPPPARSCKTALSSSKYLHRVPRGGRI